MLEQKERRWSRAGPAQSQARGTWRFRRELLELSYDPVCGICYKQGYSEKCIHRFEQVSSQVLEVQVSK